MAPADQQTKLHSFPALTSSAVSLMTLDLINGSHLQIFNRSVPIPVHLSLPANPMCQIIATKLLIFSKYLQLLQHWTATGPNSASMRTDLILCSDQLLVQSMPPAWKHAKAIMTPPFIQPVQVHRSKQIYPDCTIITEAQSFLRPVCNQE